MVINNKRELWIARTCIFASLVTLAGLFHALFAYTLSAYAAHDTHAVIETIIFAVAMFFVAYGNMLYQICLAGYHKRMHKYRAAPRSELEALYDGNSPSLSFLVPSYKEEASVIWQTLVSAALAEYPQKDVVLLIDDPYRPKTKEDLNILERSRSIPVTLQRLFAEQKPRFDAELAAFEKRLSAGKVHAGVECNRLSMLFDEVANWLDAMAEDYLAGRSLTSISHVDRFFIETVIGAPARAHRERACELRSQVHACSVSMNDVLRQYKRLCGLFAVRFTSFERKKYVSFSTEANKAMNINSYISLMGKSWKEVEVRGELVLEECESHEADFTVAAPDFVNTIDADSQTLHDYALKLVTMMQKPENKRVAVIQSPCSAYPGATGGIERAAGAAIDMQFETHQGYTHWDATFWVGANAMLRFTALNDVREVRYENGHAVAVYIKDTTVIEDTESSVDLVHKGWKLCNYVGRMTFSSMPTDFGSLLIQRRRWANGGLLILPKLFRYVARAPKNLALLREFFMRFNYLTSSPSGCLSALLLFVYSLGRPHDTLWMPASMVPFFLLYIRDLRNSKYSFADMLRIFALNLMLLPVIMGGVLKSLEQMATGRKIPFSRTPKVPGRTSAPALYSLIELMLPFICVGCATFDATHHYWVAATVSAMNAALLLYSLLMFLGLTATAQDVAAGVKGLKLDFGKMADDLLAPVRRLSLFMGKPQEG